MKPVDMDKIYREKLLAEIPWNFEEPPPSLVEIVESGKVKPCKAIEFGCGTGNYAIYFASNGFEVTAIDIAPTAIEAAKKSAKEKDIDVIFLVADVLGDLELSQDYEFAYDWEVLHHIFPENRKKYVKNMFNLLKPGGKYLSVCFSEQDPCFGGKDKFRTTPLGTVLYFSSEEELKELFEQYFNIIELKTIEIRGKPVTHQAVYAFMER